MGYTSNFAKTRINIANQCWSLLNGVIIALVVTRFRRRWMFMLSSGSMCAIFTAMTISFQRLRFAKDHHTKNQSAAIAALIFYFAYSPTYNIGNNSLTYTYLVELFPYAQRTMGIGVEQIFGKLGGFFSTNVNPLALDAIGWKFLAIYCGWIVFEFLTVYFLYPETYNRTLEELTFCKFPPDPLPLNRKENRQKLTVSPNSVRRRQAQGGASPRRREATSRCTFGRREELGHRRRARSLKATPSADISHELLILSLRASAIESWRERFFILLTFQIPLLEPKIASSSIT